MIHHIDLTMGFKGTHLIHPVRTEFISPPWNIDEIVEFRPKFFMINKTSFMTLEPTKHIRMYSRPFVAEIGKYCSCEECKSYFIKGVPNDKKEILWESSNKS